MKNWVSIAWNIGWVSDGVYRKVFKWVLAICNACDWCRFCDIRFYLQQNKITKILNEKSRRKIFVRVENSVYITWHRHRIIFSFLYFFLRLIVVWGPPTETAYKKPLDWRLCCYAPQIGAEVKRRFWNYSFQGRRFFIPTAAKEVRRVSLPCPCP